MPVERKKKRGRVGVYKWIGHVEVYFDDDEKQAVEAHFSGVEPHLEDAIAAITQQETAVKFSYDDGKDAYRVTLQPKRGDHPYRGYTLGYSHVDLLRLSQIARYICDVMMDDGSIERPENTKANDW